MPKTMMTIMMMMMMMMMIMTDPFTTNLVVKGPVVKWVHPTEMRMMMMSAENPPFIPLDIILEIRFTMIMLIKVVWILMGFQDSFYHVRVFLHWLHLKLD